MAVAKKLPKAKVAEKPKPKPKVRPKKSRRKAPPPTPSGVWTWKTPDESSKLRFALGLVVILLTAVTLLSGEIKPHHGGWRAGFHNLRGEFVLGLEWTRGEWPRRWVAH
ncbi:hypothetical protein ABS71_03275 [bacterium SCN 62-11]|nr:hypothetical protein [Candidatus Eremiobacteraeota bacterium]ODT76626.1 MAG: hypothetical protein ABS71_03275 [bacterium SCN 62-11]